ncbi:hypothetical protein ACQR35_02705 [Pseudarthrobacter sp. J1738]|uniref:hypothetical protein n=1 Tax=Pseudarthrobacter sp. J1738 TaxID=3420446 RepID=UPI003D2C3B53
MRSFIAFLATVLGLVLTAVAGPAIWVDQNLVQESGFVKMAQPLGEDQEFQVALASATSRSIVSELNLPDVLSEAITPVVNAAAKGITKLPGYEAAWTESLRRSHHLTITGEAGTAQPSGFTFDAAPMVQLLADSVSSKLPVKFTAPKQVLLPVGSQAQRQVLDFMVNYAPLGYYAAGGAVLAFLLALVSARRRGITLMVMGVGVALIAAVWKVGGGLAAEQLLTRSDAEALSGVLGQRLANEATTVLDSWFLIFLAAAGVLFVVGIIVQAISRSREARARR